MRPIQLSLPTPFAVGPVNAWLLPGDEPALVDVGPRTEAAWEALRAALSMHGLAPGNLRHIFLTHAHVDHYGNAARLAEAAPHAVLYAPDIAHARPMMEDREAEWARQVAFTHRALLASGLPAAIAVQGEAYLRRMRSFGAAVPVTHWVQPGEQLRLGPSLWEVVALPGHSTTQVGLWQREAGWLLAADHLLPHISSNALLEPPAPGATRRPRALPQYVETLRWTLALPPLHIFPGHGDPFNDQHSLVTRRLQGIEERATRLHTTLAERPHSVIKLVHHLFPHLRPDELFLAVSEVVGHLDILEARGQVDFWGDPVREYYAKREM